MISESWNESQIYLSPLGNWRRAKNRQKQKHKFKRTVQNFTSQNMSWWQLLQKTVNTTGAVMLRKRSKYTFFPNVLKNTIEIKKLDSGMHIILNRRLDSPYIREINWVGFLKYAKLRKSCECAKQNWDTVNRLS